MVMQTTIEHEVTKSRGKEKKLCQSACTLLVTFKPKMENYTRNTHLAFSIYLI